MIKEENERTPVQQNCAAIICTIQQRSGKTMEEFCAAAGFDEKKLLIDLQRGRIRLKTATHLLAANGYVCVINYEYREVPKYLILDDFKEDPFDVDWNTYRLTDFLWNAYHIDRGLITRVAHKLGISTRTICNVFQNDDGDLSRIIKLADFAGLEAKLLIKKDEEAAKILMQRLKVKSNAKQE